jgi:hypothetical protein
MYGSPDRLRSWVGQRKPSLMTDLWMKSYYDAHRKQDAANKTNAVNIHGSMKYSGLATVRLEALHFKLGASWMDLCVANFRPKLEHEASSSNTWKATLLMPGDWSYR